MRPVKEYSEKSLQQMIDQFDKMLDLYEACQQAAEGEYLPGDVLDCAREVFYLRRKLKLVSADERRAFDPK